jgi:hypothetical protein
LIIPPPLLIAVRTSGLPPSDQSLTRSNINLTHRERIIFVALLLLALILFILFSLQHKAGTVSSELRSVTMGSPQRNVSSGDERNGEHELVSLIEEKFSSSV